MSNADILKAAKQLLIDKTWVQGDELACYAGEERGCYCAASAIAQVLDQQGLRECNYWRTRSVPAVFDIFKEAAGIDNLKSIGTWNDAPERTKDEVLAAFDKAIALAEAA